MKKSKTKNISMPLCCPRKSGHGRMPGFLYDFLEQIISGDQRLMESYELELYHTQLEVRQNHIMTILTVVTAIFMPLTLIAGWYGMNFRYMPELEAPYGYLIVIVISAIIAAGSLIYFKVKKWL